MLHTRYRGETSVNRAVMACHRFFLDYALSNPMAVAVGALRQAYRRCLP